MSLRFAVGDRVRCRIAPMEWAPGCIVATSYREPDWPPGRVAPYQIELDDSRLIFAPFDDDGLIRSEADFEQLLYKDKQASEKNSAAYRKDILARFPQKHAAIYQPAELERFVEPALMRALSLGGDDRTTTLCELLREEARGLYSLRIFTMEFCRLLLEECEHFEAWCAEAGVDLHRPNTMNNHGAILDDFGMSAMMDAVMTRCIQPLAVAAGFADVGGDVLVDHHAFLVSYALDKDKDLKFHVDQSDVTVNVCLGRQFEGGGLFFRGVRCPAHQQTGAQPEEEVTFEHVAGRALLHRGHHRHGAHPIRSGERHNLILWCRGDTGRPATSEACERDGRACQPWCWMHP